MYLLQKGADPTCRSCFGTKAIDRARDQGHDDVVRLLEQAEERRAADPQAELFPEWRYPSTGHPSKPEMMAGLLSAVETRRVRPNQNPPGVFSCAVCKDLDFRRAMEPQDHVVYFLEQSSMESATASGCRGCQFLTDCIATIKNAHGVSVLETAPPDGRENLLILHSTGQGAPLMMQTSDPRSVTGRRIEVYVDKSKQPENLALLE